MFSEKQIVGVREFIKYCEVHQNYPNRGEYCENHDSWVDNILDNPGLVEIKDAELKYKDVVLTYNNKVIGEIDLIFITLRDIYICELKMNEKCWFQQSRLLKLKVEQYLQNPKS